jgi:hypothetical protein
MPKKLGTFALVDYDNIFCVKCKSKTDNDETGLIKTTSNDRRVFETHCADCGTKKMRFVKKAVE